MGTRNNSQFMATIQTPFLPVAMERSVVSVNRSLSRIVGEMRALNTSYENAVRQFEERYIIAVLVKHACHLGRVAEDLGMHRNTLTRTNRRLGIDPKQIRKVMDTLRGVQNVIKQTTSEKIVRSN